MTQPITCPKCGKSAMVHCPPERSKTCDLILCRTCDAYGLRDGRLWSPVLRTKDGA